MARVLRFAALALVALGALGVGEGLGEWRPPEPGEPGPFGMDGYTATETTRAAMLALREFQDTGNLRREVYVNPYTGSDSGNGSEDAPYKTLAKGAEQALSYTRVKLQGGTFFSPLSLTMADNIDADGETYLIGETVSWDAAASTGVVLDWEPALSLLVIEKTTGDDPTGAGADTITGAGGMATTVTTVTNTIGSGAASFLFPDCDDGDELCILFESTDPDDPAHLNCSNTDGGSANAIFRACEDPTDCDAATTASGWVGVQNVVVDNCDTDNWDTEDTAKMFVLNSGGARVSNTAALNNNCYTPHDDSTMWVLNGWCYDHLIPSGANGSPIAPVGTTKFGIMGGFYQVDAAGGASSDVAVFSGTDHFVADVILDANGEGMDAFQFSPTTNSVAGTLRGFNIVAAGAGASNAACKFRIGSLISAATEDVDLYNLSCVDSGNGVLINHDAGLANDALNLFIRGLVITGTSADHFTTTAAQDIDGTHLDISYVADDDLTLTGDWRINATQHNTVALAAADSAVVAAGWTFFTNRVELTSGSTPDLSYQNDGATVTLADFGCHPESECWKAYDEAYTVTLQSTLYIPAFVLGREVRAFRLGGTDGNLGAR
jgi:hypothetical protein